MKIYPRSKKLLALLVCASLSYFTLLSDLSSSTYTSFSLATRRYDREGSARSTPSSPVNGSLRHLVHLRVNGSDKRDLVTQYTSQLAQYFRIRDKQPEDDSVYKRRQSIVEDVCKRNQTDMRIQPKFSKFMYIEYPPVLYCPVAKVGSTFWGRVLSVIERRDPRINSQFQILHGQPIHRNVPLMKERLGKTQKEILSSQNKFIFTRDPYQRIFSVFIDKFLAPNSYLWGLAKRAILKFRSSTSDNETISGSNLQFYEYIKYINMQDKGNLNEHIKPVTYICDMCGFKFDVIGKAETFETDVKFILKRIGVLDKEIVLHDMTFEKDLDHLVDNVDRAFSLKYDWLKFISWHAGMVRLWRQLQINGLIDMTDTYPFSPEQSHNLTVVEYVNVALEAFRRSSPAGKRNKREAYLQAYSMVEPEDLEQLRKGYLTDFEMFDYEQRPEELFDMDRKRTFEYDYFDVMQLK